MKENLWHPRGGAGRGSDLMTTGQPPARSRAKDMLLEWDQGGENGDALAIPRQQNYCTLHDYQIGIKSTQTPAFLPLCAQTRGTVPVNVLRVDPPLPAAWDRRRPTAGPSAGRDVSTIPAPGGAVLKLRPAISRGRAAVIESSSRRGNLGLQGGGAPLPQRGRRH